MKSLLKCLSVTIFCLLLIGCGEQNTVTNNPTERDQLSNNSNTQAEDDDNLDLLNPSQAQTEHDQLASEDLSQDEVIGENTDLNLASLVDSRSVKPTSSILSARKSITKAGEPTEVVTKGRHDPCVGIRAVPVAEAMMACVLLDHFLVNRGQVGNAIGQIG